MKHLRHCLALAAICLALPASADEKSNKGTLTLVKPDGQPVPVGKSDKGTFIFSGEKPGAGTLIISEPQPENSYVGKTMITGGVLFNNAPATDAEGMLLLIDLRVTLQHYEKLTTEINETQLQRELALLGDSVGPQGSSPLAEAMKAQRKLREDTSATNEAVEAANQQVRALSEAEAAKWERRAMVLSRLADHFRGRIQILAKEINQRAEASAAAKLKAAPALPAKPTP